MIPAAIRTEILFDPLALLLLPVKIKEYGEKTARSNVYLSGFVSRYARYTLCVSRFSNR